MTLIGFPPRGSGCVGRSRPDAGFTLIEMIVAASLMALVLVSAYACLDAGFATRRLLEPRLEAVQTARIVLAMASADLRGACPLSREAAFVGADRTLGGWEVDGMDFGTHHYTPGRPGEGDFCQISYFVEWDPTAGEGVLWRRRNPFPGQDPFTGGSREEIARGVRGLKLEYYDGFDWYDHWGDADGRRQAREASSLRQDPTLTGLPNAVRITLTLAVGGQGPRGSLSDSNPGQGSSPAEPGSVPSGEGVLVLQTVVAIPVPAPVSEAGGGGENAPAAGAPPAPGGVGS